MALIGLAKYHSDGSILELKKLQHLLVYQEGIPEFFPNPKIQRQKLSELENGWLEGDGKSFQQSDVDMVQQWLENLLKTGDIPAPFIYPAENNVIECEWSFGYWEISFSFLLPLKAVVLHAAHVNSEEVREDRLILQDHESIEKAMRFLKSILISIPE